MKDEQSIVPTYGRISKLYIIQIRIYRFFCFADKICVTKTEQSDVATYGRKFRSIYFDRYNYLDNVLFLDCQEQASVSVKRVYVCR